MYLNSDSVEAYKKSTSKVGQKTTSGDILASISFDSAILISPEIFYRPANYAFAEKYIALHDNYRLGTTKELQDISKNQNLGILKNLFNDARANAKKVKKSFNFWTSEDYRRDKTRAKIVEFNKGKKSYTLKKDEAMILSIREISILDLEHEF